MQIKTLFGMGVIWVMLICTGISAPKNMAHKTKPSATDTVGVDEEPIHYPALDLEELCKQTKNPKCEAIVDNFCAKTCRADLCANHGSIRGMCRLMCELEDLLPQCAKMGPSKSMKKKQRREQAALTTPALVQ